MEIWIIEVLLYMYVIYAYAKVLPQVLCGWKYDMLNREWEINVTRFEKTQLPHTIINIQKYQF